MSVFKRVSGLFAAAAWLARRVLAGAVSPVPGQVSGPTPDQCCRFFRDSARISSSRSLGAVTGGGGGWAAAHSAASGANSSWSPDQMSREMDRRQQMRSRLAQRDRLRKRRGGTAAAGGDPAAQGPGLGHCRDRLSLPPRPVPPYLQAHCADSARRCTPRRRSNDPGRGRRAARARPLTRPRRLPPPRAAYHRARLPTLREKSRPDRRTGRVRSRTRSGRVSMR